MVDKMWAHMFYEPGKVKFEQTDIPKPNKGEVLVKVKAATTCGTDLKTYKRGHPTIFKGRSMPAAFGHEFSGDIVTLGEGVDTFSVGDRVVAANSAPCFQCSNCKRNEYSLCKDLHYLNGAYAEYIVIPERILKYNTYKIPNHVSYEVAALLEPLACCVHGIDRTPITVGDTVVVVGVGPIGLGFVTLAHQRGAKVYTVDMSEERLEVSKSFGAIQGFNAKDPELVAKIKALTTDQDGVDSVIEATGFPEAWQTATNLVRPGGHVLLFGGTKSGTNFAIDCQKFHYEEMNILAVYHHTPFHVKKTFDMLCDGRLDGEMFITDRFPLSKAIEALELIAEQKGIKYALFSE